MIRARQKPLQSRRKPLDPKTARGWLDLILDPGYTRLFDDIVGGDPIGFPGYADAVAKAREQTGETESVVVAEGVVGGRGAVAIASEFGFLGGSMGVAAGTRICSAFEHAAARGLPVVGLLASGGARMQEGMLALAQMPATLQARARLAAAHLPFIAYLRHPTTGGVYASFAASADLLWAQPEATIGFAGPRVAEAVTGEPLPEGSHTAEMAENDGLVDELLHPESLRSRLAAVLALLDDRGGPPAASRPAPVTDEQDAWDAVLRARDAERPTGVDYVGDLAPIQRYGNDPTIVAGLARIAGTTVVAIAQNVHVNDGRTTPGGYRRARNAIATAERLRLPIVTFIDTPGADPSHASERAGIAHEISATFRALIEASVPTVACVVGEGGSGGALALAACDRLLIQRNAIFSVIAPEGAAAILKRDDIAAVARALKLRSVDLYDYGIADAIVDEPNDGAQTDHEAARLLVEDAIAWALGDIAAAPSARRTKRWPSA